MDLYMFGSERAQLGLPSEHHTPATLESHLYGIHSLAAPHRIDAGHWASLPGTDDSLAILALSGLYASPG
jgi:hypothetical protein